ncbi:eCIS core domain-containing protein, partial [Halogeometricum borinquense]|uniref:eCIS core domain-containing protein n=1 Tax=Halogeometricum borinquense TaxID=60847 RepID=UPI001F5DADC0
QVREWADEGMTVDTMGKPRDMRAFRQRQKERPAEVPKDIERRNAKSVQRSRGAHHEASKAGDANVPDSVRDVISSPGQQLDTSIQRAMEDRMGDNLGDVRVHTGPSAAKACEDINARAFTVGNHIAFNHGEYDPSSAEGQHVLAHELAHVRQQTGGAVSMLPQAGELEIDPDPRLEREAEETAQRVMQGGKIGVHRMEHSDVHVQRVPQSARLGLALSKFDIDEEQEEKIRALLESYSEGSESLRPELLAALLNANGTDTPRGFDFAGDLAIDDSGSLLSDQQEQLNDLLGYRTEGNASAVDQVIATGDSSALEIAERRGTDLFSAVMGTTVEDFSEYHAATLGKWRRNLLTEIAEGHESERILEYLARLEETMDVAQRDATTVVNGDDSINTLSAADPADEFDGAAFETERLAAYARQSDYVEMEPDSGNRVDILAVDGSKATWAEQKSPDKGHITDSFIRRVLESAVKKFNSNAVESKKEEVSEEFTVGEHSQILEIKFKSEDTARALSVPETKAVLSRVISMKQKRTEQSIPIDEVRIIVNGELIFGKVSPNGVEWR